MFVQRKANLWCSILLLTSSFVSAQESADITYKGISSSWGCSDPVNRVSDPRSALLVSRELTNGEYRINYAEELMNIEFYVYPSTFTSEFNGYYTNTKTKKGGFWRSYSYSFTDSWLSFGVTLFKKINNALPECEQIIQFTGRHEGPRISSGAKQKDALTPATDEIASRYRRGSTDALAIDAILQEARNARKKSTFNNPE